MPLGISKTTAFSDGAPKHHHRNGATHSLFGQYGCQQWRPHRQKQYDRLCHCRRYRHIDVFGAATHRFTGIRMNVSSLPVSLVEGNTITAISHTSTSGANTNYAVFSGIYLEAGNTAFSLQHHRRCYGFGGHCHKSNDQWRRGVGYTQHHHRSFRHLTEREYDSGHNAYGGTGTANTGVTLEAISSAIVAGMWLP